MQFYIKIILLAGCLILVNCSEPNASRTLQQEELGNIITPENSNSSINGIKTSSFSEVSTNDNISLEENQQSNNYTRFINHIQESLNSEIDENTKLVRRNVNEELKTNNFSDSNFGRYNSLYSREKSENLVNNGRDESNYNEVRDKNPFHGPTLNEKIEENRKFIFDPQSFNLKSFHDDHGHDDFYMNDNNRIFNPIIYPSMTNYEGSQEFSNSPKNNFEKTSNEMQSFEENVPLDSLIPLQMEKRSEVLLKDLDQQVEYQKSSDDDIHKDAKISDDKDHNTNSFPGSIIEKAIMNLRSSENEYQSLYGEDFHHTYNFAPKSLKENNNHNQLSYFEGLNEIEEDTLNGGSNNYVVPFNAGIKLDHEKENPNFGGDFHHTYNAVSFIPRVFEEKHWKLNPFKGINSIKEDNIDYGAPNYVPFDSEMKSDSGKEYPSFGNDFHHTHNAVPVSDNPIGLDENDNFGLNSFREINLKKDENFNSGATNNDGIENNNVEFNSFRGINKIKDDNSKRGASNNVNFEEEIKYDHEKNHPIFSDGLHHSFGGDFHHTYNDVSLVPRDLDEDNDGKLNGIREMNVIEKINLVSQKCKNNVAPLESNNDVNIMNKNYDNMLNDHQKRSLKNVHKVHNNHSTLNRNMDARNDVHGTFNEDNLPTKPRPGFVPQRTGRKRFKIKKPQNDDRD